VVLGTLTATGSTPAVEVSGNNFTFVHTTTGGNITIDDEGSLDGASWFSLDEAKSHSESGVDAHFYSPRIIRYVRSTVTVIQSGASVSIAMACD